VGGRHHRGRHAGGGRQVIGTCCSAWPRLAQHAALEPRLRDRRRAAVERRYDALRDTAGLNADVFDALIVLAAGDWTPDAIRTGYLRVRRLQPQMGEGRSVAAVVRSTQG
jgi:hypothetical protein